MLNNQNENSTILNSSQFHITLQAAKLLVLSITTKHIPKISWWLVREFGLNKAIRQHFNSILLDDDGLSIVCEVSHLSILEELINSDEFTLSPQNWRAFVINVTGSAFDLPGAVYYLANVLSSYGLSILHISTFESEVFLVQESDILTAIQLLKETQKVEKDSVEGVISSKYNSKENLSKPSNTMQLKETINFQKSNSSQHYEKEDEYESNLDMSWIATPRNSSFMASGSNSHSDEYDKLASNGDFTLRVLPNHVILAKLNDNFDIMECSSIIINLLLYDPRFNDLERRCSKRLQVRKDSAMDPVPFSIEAKSAMTSRENSEFHYDIDVDDHDIPNESDDVHHPQKDIKATYMWGIWQCDNEMTFLLDENDVALFPPGALILSPQRWRVIKLCGRPIDFNETGIVCSMSKIESNIPSLNISTATTNCTLVPEELLERTLTTLSDIMHCPISDG